MRLFDIKTLEYHGTIVFDNTLFEKFLFEEAEEFKDPRPIPDENYVDIILNSIRYTVKLKASSAIIIPPQNLGA